ncbi:carbohydrate-binding domain-containing protein [Clostridiales bacterium]|nr:carbohydrate-binding domain-containing protein [Clostridiales bacterium]
MKLWKKLAATACVVAALVPIGILTFADNSDVVKIKISDNNILVDGKEIKSDSKEAVYTGAEIIYYKAGTDASYWEGTEADMHTKEEAEEHTVVTITKPGSYEISGKLSKGQIAVDLGEDAEKDKNEAVTLILNNVDITCTVAPAIIFYNVYECGSADIETAKADVDTSMAGAKVIVADGSVNNINGSYVARIYKEGTTKKLHKYDGAFYSKMSMEIDGGEKGDGVLNINAENEGLDSELHLTINGGNIYIKSGDDGINTNEDGVSVTTINGGYLNIFAGNGVEGDGIDSNGFVSINGGTVISIANPLSMDSGIDSDMGIYINGGTVVGAGRMYDEVSENSKQNFMMLEFTDETDNLITVTDENDNPLFAFDFPYSYTCMVFSTTELKEGTYHVYSGGEIEGSEADGLYMDIVSLTGGKILFHGGVPTVERRDNMPMPPEGEMQDFRRNEEPTDNMEERGTNKERKMPPQIPDGGRPHGSMDMQPSADEESFDFKLRPMNL